MFRIPCPHCGLRNVSEFRHAGAAAERPDPASVSPGGWRAYLYEERNVAGWTAESWFHAFGCRRFVMVERHTVTNQVRPAGNGAGPDDGAPDQDGAP